MKIEELLASRTDLSTFLVHLTRDSEGRSAKEALKKIITDDRLIAREPYGVAVKTLREKGLDTVSQRVVCFTETPMEHLSLLASEIDNRNFRFAPYGVALTRKQCRSRGVNPVWYVDITPGHNWLTQPLNAMIEVAIATGDFGSQPVSKVSPFVEPMGVKAPDPETGAQGYRKEFWWEREWRFVGDFALPPTYMVLCPTSDMRELKGCVDGIDEATRPRVSFIDPFWSLESIIGKLAGFSSNELGPF